MRPNLVRGCARWQAGVALAGAALLAAACGSVSGSPSGASSPGAPRQSAAARQSAAKVCQDAAGLRTSLNALTHLKQGTATPQQITTDLGAVRAELTRLGTDAHGRLRAQVNALKPEVAKLQADVTSLRQNPANATAQNNAMATLQTVAAGSAGVLVSARAACG